MGLGGCVLRIDGEHIAVVLTGCRDIVFLFGNDGQTVQDAGIFRTLFSNVQQQYFNIINIVGIMQRVIIFLGQ